MKAKHLIKCLFTMAVGVCLTIGCEKKFGEGVVLTDIETGNPVRINLGDKAYANAWPVPWNCTDYEFTWETADSNIATIDAYGRVTPVDVGNTVVYVSQGNIRKEIPVEVYEITLEEKLKDMNVKGLWLFEDADNLFKASVGNDLRPVGSGFEQITGPNKRKKAIKMPCDERINGVWQRNHVICNHGFAPNGGSVNKINEFTIVVDCNFPGGPTNDASGWTNGKYYCLYETDMICASDGDFFWRPIANYGVRGSYTNEDHLFVKDTWYRFVIVVKMGESLKYFMNGQSNEAGNNGDLDSDKAWLTEGVLFFADEDGENGQGFPLYVSALGIFDRALTDAEVKSLGGL